MGACYAKAREVVTGYAKTSVGRRQKRHFVSGLN